VALTNFNHVMNMQTIALSDSGWLSHLRNDISLKEMYRTRLVRVDLPPAQSDPIRRILHIWLRKLWYTKRAKLSNPENPKNPLAAPSSRGHQNTITIADIMARFLFACVAGSMLILPLSILSYQSKLSTRLLTISLFIVVFAFMLSLVSPASNQTVMGTAAAYAAVLSVFVSTNLGS
jgi:hypothetical protein